MAGQIRFMDKNNKMLFYYYRLYHFLQNIFHYWKKKPTSISDIGRIAATRHTLSISAQEYPSVVEAIWS